MDVTIRITACFRFPPAIRLGPVTSGVLQEAEVNGGVLSLALSSPSPYHPCPLLIPSTEFLASHPWIMSFNYSDLFCNHELSISPWSHPQTTYIGV